MRVINHKVKKIIKCFIFLWCFSFCNNVQAYIAFDVRPNDSNMSLEDYEDYRQGVLSDEKLQKYLEPEIAKWKKEIAQTECSQIVRDFYDSFNDITYPISEFDIIVRESSKYSTMEEFIGMTNIQLIYLSSCKKPIQASEELKSLIISIKNNSQNFTDLSAYQKNVIDSKFLEIQKEISALPNNQTSLEQLNILQSKYSYIYIGDINYGKKFAQIIASKEREIKQHIYAQETKKPYDNINNSNVNTVQKKSNTPETKSSSIPWVKIMFISDIILAIAAAIFSHRNFKKKYAEYPIVNENGFSTIVNDLQLSFSSAYRFFYSMIIPLVFSYMLASFGNNVLFSIGASILLATVIIYSAAIFGTYNSGIYISSKLNILNVPAKNLENSFIDWITLKPIRDSILRREIKITDINYAHFSTFTTRHSKDKYGIYHSRIHHYALNIAGNFGSIMLDFRSSQKRDELAGYLRQASDDLNHKITIRHI